MRWLVCQTCRETVGVMEEPVQHIDPDLYVCGNCYRQVAGQLELNPEPRTETRAYDPATSLIPY